MSGSVHPLTIPGCNFFCKYEDFSKILQPIIPYDIKKQCITDSADTEDASQASIDNGGGTQGQNCSSSPGLEMHRIVDTRHYALIALIPINAVLSLVIFYKTITAVIGLCDLRRIRNILSSY